MSSRVPRICRSPTRASTPSPRASRRTTSKTSEQPCESWRGSRGDSSSSRICATGTRPSRRPSAYAIRRTSAAIRRTSGARCSSSAGLNVEAVELFDVEIELEPGSRARAAQAKRRRRFASCWRTGSTAAGSTSPRIVLKGRRVVAIIVDRDTRLVVQGMTGREGSFHTLRNRDYGTKIVAGVTPGKGGEDVEGIPVFDTVADAVEQAGANTSMVFVPARFAADAIFEAADAGIGTVVCIAEGLPAHDMLRVYNYMRPRGVTMIGPNCPACSRPARRTRDHSGRDLPRGRRRPRLALRHAHVPDRSRADAARARQLDHRRNRRRSGRRLVVRRRAREVRG